MAEPLLVIQSRRVVIEGAIKPAAIHIRGERIERVADHGDIPAGAKLEDVGELAVMPGIVDPHVEQADYMTARDRARTAAMIELRARQPSMTQLRARRAAEPEARCQ